jgi:hypothetical protein
VGDREATPPHRAGDGESDDYRDLRRPIDGNEVSIGYGNKRLTLRGGMTIGVVGLFVVLLGIGYIIREQDRLRMELPGNSAEQHRAMARAFDQAFRLQTCVLALTPDERVVWRSSREPRGWLFGMCPGLLLQSGEPMP